MLTAREPSAGRPTWPLGQGPRPYAVGQEGRLSGAGGRPEVARGAQRLARAGPPRSSRAASRVFTARLVGSSRHREDSTEPRGTDKGYIGAQLAGSVPATHTEAQAGTSGPRERRPDLSWRGSSGRSDSEATSN
jgi:hypothetical protein